MAETSEAEEIKDYSTEIELGIFNLVISLVSHQAARIGYPKARANVAGHLEHLAKALRELEQS